MAPSKLSGQKSKPIIPARTILTKSGIISKSTSSLKLQKSRELNHNVNQQRPAKIEFYGWINLRKVGNKLNKAKRTLSKQEGLQDIGQANITDWSDPIVNHTHKCSCNKIFNSIEVMRKHQQTHTPIKKTNIRADFDDENKSDISIMRAVMKCASPKNALVSSAKKIAKKKVIAHGGVPLSDKMKRAILGAKNFN